VEQHPDWTIVFVGGAFMQTSFIGVDVSKSELVISVDDLPPLSLVNDLAHITRWLAQLPRDCCIAMESTGRYHLLLAQLALQAGLMVYVLNARDVYFYAKALGARAKSDALDCVVIRRYVQEHFQSLYPWQPGTKVQQQLHALLTRRAQVSTHQAAIKQTQRYTSASRALDSTDAVVQGFDCSNGQAGH
jgi:transposase